MFLGTRPVLFRSGGLPEPRMSGGAPWQANTDRCGDNLTAPVDAVDVAALMQLVHKYPPYEAAQRFACGLGLSSQKAYEVGRRPGGQELLGSLQSLCPPLSPANNVPIARFP